jgi:predicted nucleic acid-binding protein
MGHIDSIVAVDSMTLVWGLRRDGPEEKCRRAKWLFDQFSAHKIQVIVPSVAASEYLTATDPSTHAGIIAAMEKRFLILPFDQHCASMAANLFQMGREMRVKGEPGGRAILRADTLIIATAKTFGAETIYTTDDDCRILASKVMNALDLPEPAKGLFGQFIE